MCKTNDENHFAYPTKRTILLWQGTRVSCTMRRIDYSASRQRTIRPGRGEIVSQIVDPEKITQDNLWNALRIHTDILTYTWLIGSNIHTRTGLRHVTTGTRGVSNVSENSGTKPKRYSLRGDALSDRFRKASRGDYGPQEYRTDVLLEHVENYLASLKTAISSADGRRLEKKASVCCCEADHRRSKLPLGSFETSVITIRPAAWSKWTSGVTEAKASLTALKVALCFISSIGKSFWILYQGGVCIIKECVKQAYWGIERW